MKFVSPFGLSKENLDEKLEVYLFIWYHENEE